MKSVREGISTMQKNLIDIVTFAWQWLRLDWLDRARDQVVGHILQPMDASSLAVFRISYGLLMTIDIPMERGFSVVDANWGNPEICHFPLINSLPVLPYEWMSILYLVMWLGAIGIMLGYRFYTSCLLYAIPYWYLILLEKTNWNNHTYMFGLIAILLFCTKANAYWSVEKSLPGTNNRTNTEAQNVVVPTWNYFILRFQVFILYFMAGVKKINYDWLGGYSVMNLSYHPVFDPFRMLLTEDQINLWIIHLFGFLLDISAGFGLYFNKTRPITLVFLFLFHFMNSRMFAIGMFPYVGIATMFIFCDPSWPKKVLCKLHLLPRVLSAPPRKDATTKAKTNSTSTQNEKHTFHTYKILILIGLHVVGQLFLPFSHFITKGYNGWTNGQYGYSWDMMVNSWDTLMVVTNIKDKDTGETFYLDTDAWTLDDKWSRHPDMVKQFSSCVQANLQRKHYLKNISVHLDVWYSLNGRFHQRMFDPRVDLLQAEWSPFQSVSWLMPLLSELTPWRPTLRQIEDDLSRESEFNAAAFFTDFPGFYMDTFVDEELENVTLTVLQGKVQVEVDNNSTLQTVDAGESLAIPSNVFLRIHSIWHAPSCYYYSYFNRTLLNLENLAQKEDDDRMKTKATSGSKRNILMKYLVNVGRAMRLVISSVVHILKDYAPMMGVGCL